MNEHKHGSPELPPPNHLKYWQMGTGNVKPLSSIPQFVVKLAAK